MGFRNMSILDMGYRARLKYRPSTAYFVGIIAPMPLFGNFDTGYILNGGFLHRYPWQTGYTYNSVCGQNVRYVIGKYRAEVLIFDGCTRQYATHMMSAWTSISLDEWWSNSHRKASFDIPLTNYVTVIIWAKRRRVFQLNFCFFFKTNFASHGVATEEGNSRYLLSNTVWGDRAIQLKPN